MTSRGLQETKDLIQNLQDQLERLVTQLDELEQSKDELDLDEYEESKKDTLEQFDDIRRSLEKFSSGSKSLIDEVGAMQLAIQAAISKAFKTPEIIGMFAKNEPKLLRDKLKQIDLDLKLERIPTNEGTQTKLEILTALRKLGDTLSAAEENFLRMKITNELEKFQRVDSSQSSINDHMIFRIASNSEH